MLFSAVSFVSPQMKGEFEGYEACPESKDTKVLNMYIFNLQKRHCE